MAVPITLKSKEQTAISKDISTEALINCFPTLRPGNAVSDLFLIGSHGWVEFGTGTAASQVRGSICNDEGTVGFIVVDDKLYSVDTGGTRTLRGTIGTSSGILRMVIGTTHLFFVDGIDGYTLKLSDYTFLTITDVLFPDAPIDVTFLGGYYIVAGQISGEYVVALSAIDDPSSWPVTNELYPADIPGTIKAVKAFNKELWIFGTTTTEVWINTPGQGAGAFPLTQSYVHSWGLAAGYSPAILSTGLYCIGRSKGIKAALLMCQGSTITEIDNEDMNRLLQSFSTVSDAFAYCYEDAGQQL